MRSLVVVLVLVLAPAVAHAQVESPPSPTLERAIKLYDKQDYLSASIELRKVTDGETADDATNVHRAEFFQAKTSYQLGWYAYALTLFQQIADDAAHPYHDATLKWLLGLARLLPVGSGILQTFLAYPPGQESSSFLESELHDEYAALEGMALLANGSFDDALNIAHMVPTGSPQWSAAQRVIGEVLFRTGDIPGGVAAYTEAVKDPAIAVLAVRELVFWSRITGNAAVAGDALRGITDGLAAPYATYAASRLAHELPALRGLTDTFDGLAMVAVCGQGHVDDLVAAIKPRADAVTKELRTLASPDDNVEFFEGVTKRLDQDDPVAHVLRIALGRAEPLYWVAELTHEQEVFDQADAAWRTTGIAAEVQSELALQLALAHADAGQWLRDRFDQIAVELGRVAQADGQVVADSSGDGLVVPPALCQEAGLPSTAPMVPREDPLPLPPPAKAHGCAGCASTDPAPGLILLVLFVLRRRHLTPAG